MPLYMHGTCRDLYRAPTTSWFQGYGPAVPRYIGATLYYGQYVHLGRSVDTDKKIILQPVHAPG